MMLIDYQERNSATQDFNQSHCRNQSTFVIKYSAVTKKINMKRWGKIDQLRNCYKHFSKITDYGDIFLQDARLPPGFFPPCGF